jgi:very-short-patch-repair endonuclease
VQKRLDLKIATIDRFQGGQADIILFSLVAGPQMARQTLNFLARDRRRINVAVSRARALCIVFGDQAFARESKISHIAYLAERAGRTPRRDQAAFESLWERRMAAALERRGLAYEAQYPVGWRRLDFALFRDAVKLDLEVDGRAYHMDADGNRKIRDIQRDREMIARGWKVRRFWVHELDHDMEACLDIIERDLAGI